MKDFNHIDELIRQKFEGFEPSPPDSVWERIKGQIGPEPPAPRGGSINMPIITGLLMLVGLVSMLLFMSHIENTMDLQAANGPEFMETSMHSAILSSDKQFADAILAVNTSSSRDEDPADRLVTSNIPVRKPFEGQVSHYSEAIPDQAKEGVNATFRSTHKSKVETRSRFSDQAGRLQSKDFDGELETPEDNGENLYERTSTQHAGDYFVERSKPQLSVGFHFNPEVSFHPGDSRDNALDYGFQVLPRLSFNNWYVQSGLGVRTGGDRGNYTVNYNKYLGSYEDVYDITFDSTENGVVPTFYTQTVDVYDTIPYYSISEAKSTYTYLDIPLMVGYQWKFKNASFFVNAGPAISLLIGQSNLKTDLPQENIRILNESSQIPVRDQINWQMMAGAGFDYSLSDKFSFSLEPTFRYYLTNGYSNADMNTRHPYSFGIRAGIIYHINH